MKKQIKPRYFMTLRKETMTEEIGWRLVLANPLLSALTILLSASFNILLPISNVLSLISLSLWKGKLGFMSSNGFGVAVGEDGLDKRK